MLTDPPSLWGFCVQVSRGFRDKTNAGINTRTHVYIYFTRYAKINGWKRTRNPGVNPDAALDRRRERRNGRDRFGDARERDSNRTWLLYCKNNTTMPNNNGYERRIVSYRRRCPGGSSAAADPGKCKTDTLYVHIYIYILIYPIPRKEEGTAGGMNPLVLSAVVSTRNSAETP